ncbi:MAG: hypothetical protein ACK5N1_03610, partial [Gemmatimonas sp.]
MAGRTHQRVDLEHLLEQGRPPAAGLGRRESWRGDDGGQRSGGGLALTPHPARAVGIPAVTCPLSGIWTNTRARNSSGSAVSVPAVGPSEGTQTAVCTWNPECGQVSMPAA